MRKFRMIETYSGALKRFVTLESRFRLGNVVADIASGNSEEIRMEVETRICTTTTDDGKW